MYRFSMQVKVEPVPPDLGQKAECTLVRSSIYYIVNTVTDNNLNSHMDNLK